MTVEAAAMSALRAPSSECRLPGRRDGHRPGLRRSSGDVVTGSPSVATPYLLREVETIAGYDRRMSFITLTTDFGTRQGSHTVLHGAIYRIAPDAVITDLSHEVKPQDIREANFVINNSVFFFPDGTIHVIVVDPGVGTERRPIAARIGTHYFVAPDNGVLSACMRRAEQEGWTMEFVNQHLSRKRSLLPRRCPSRRRCTACRSRLGNDKPDHHSAVGRKPRRGWSGGRRGHLYR